MEAASCLIHGKTGNFSNEQRLSAWRRPLPVEAPRILPFSFRGYCQKRSFPILGSFHFLSNLQGWVRWDWSFCWALDSILTSPGWSHPVVCGWSSLSRGLRWSVGWLCGSFWWTPEFRPKPLACRLSADITASVFYMCIKWSGLKLMLWLWPLRSDGWLRRTIKVSFLCRTPLAILTSRRKQSGYRL